MSTSSSGNAGRLAGLVYASLAADSLALGAHWIYDQEEIREAFGRVDELISPLPDSYHPRKTAGEQTHYGDQTLVLMDSLQAAGGYDEADFLKKWQAMWEGYGDYFDHATKETLAKINAGGGGSGSEELGGAARLAPLLAGLADQPLEEQIAAARAQTALTHNSPIALDSAEFLTRIVHGILNDEEIESAVEDAVNGDYATLDPAKLLEKLEDVKDLDAIAAAERLGLSCPAEKALPTLLMLLQRFPDDLETALIENVMAGGDSAARGLALGMILGARHGKQGVPERWISSLKSASKIEAFLAGVGGTSR